MDFSYEVSRSLAACEGAVLVVDASQGVEAQTLANTYLALEHDLEMLPVLNKIDLPAPTPTPWQEEVEDVIGLPCHGRAARSRPRWASAFRTCWRMWSAIFPRPSGDPDAPLKALIFDSHV